MVAKKDMVKSCNDFDNKYEVYRNDGMGYEKLCTQQSEDVEMFKIIANSQLSYKIMLNGVDVTKKYKKQKRR